MEIYVLQENERTDFKALLEIFKAVFEHTEIIAEDDRLDDLLSNRQFRVFVVKENHQVIGGLTVYTLAPYFGTKPTAYIYDVGIHPEFQGQGFGSALMTAVCNYCRANGFEAAYVEAELEDVEAVKFYRKTNFSTELPALHFIYLF